VGVVELGRGDAETRGKGKWDVEVWVQDSSFFCWEEGDTIRRRRNFEFAWHVVAVEQELGGGEKTECGVMAPLRHNCLRLTSVKCVGGGASEYTCKCACLSIPCESSRADRRRRRKRRRRKVLERRKRKSGKSRRCVCVCVCVRI